MATIIFDFDHTLFDTRTFKKEVDSIITKHGVSEEIAVQAEKVARSKNDNIYDFTEHVEHIKKLGATVQDSIHDHFDALDLTKYHKGEVVEIVKNLQKKGYKTILLTKGTDGFQDRKIRGAQFKELFGENIIICDGKKEEIIKTLNIDEQQTYFFNDDIPEMERIYNNFPNSTYIICKRDDNKFDYSKINPNFKLVNSINEIEQYIK